MHTVHYVHTVLDGAGTTETASAAPPVYGPSVHGIFDNFIGLRLPEKVATRGVWSVHQVGRTEIRPHSTLSPGPPHVGRAHFPSSQEKP